MAGFSLAWLKSRKEQHRACNCTMLQCKHGSLITTNCSPDIYDMQSVSRWRSREGNTCTSREESRAWEIS